MKPILCGEQFFSLARSGANLVFGPVTIYGWGCSSENACDSSSHCVSSSMQLGSFIEFNNRFVNALVDTVLFAVVFGLLFTLDICIWILAHE